MNTSTPYPSMCATSRNGTSNLFPFLRCKRSGTNGSRVNSARTSSFNIVAPFSLFSFYQPGALRANQLLQPLDVSQGNYIVAGIHAGVGGMEDKKGVLQHPSRAGICHLNRLATYEMHPEWSEWF